MSSHVSTSLWRGRFFRHMSILHLLYFFVCKISVTLFYSHSKNILCLGLIYCIHSGQTHCIRFLYFKRNREQRHVTSFSNLSISNSFHKPINCRKQKKNVFTSPSHCQNTLELFNFHIHFLQHKRLHVLMVSFFSFYL